MSTTPTSQTPVPAAPAVPTAGVWQNLHQGVRWGKRLLLAIIALWLFMTTLQVAWVYQQAADISPFLAFAWILFIGFCIYLVSAPAYRFLKTPKVVEPPPLPAPDQIQLKHLRVEAIYLDRYLKNCQRNVEFEDKKGRLEEARTEIQGLTARIKSAKESEKSELQKELTAFIDKEMTVLLSDVDAKADRLIYQEAINVGMATAASPNGTLDAFMMLWRSVNLVSKLAVLYYGRPGIWGTALICKDVSMAVAIAGYLQNVTDSLGGIIAKTVGGVSGVLAGPAIEGTTNGLVLIRIGYLAQQRCRSFRRWDAQTRKSAVLTSLQATQRVGVQLTTELIRGITTRLGNLAGAMTSGISQAAGSAAANLKGTFQAIFRTDKEKECV